MIKYRTQLGAKHLNMEAANQRDYAYKPFLSGMHCGKCKGVDTIIQFYQMSEPIRMVNARINACCPEFELHIRTKIGKAEG
jgi:hypothetical protein